MYQGTPETLHNRVTRTGQPRLSETNALTHLLKRISQGHAFSEYFDLQDKTLDQAVQELLSAPFHFTYPLKDYNSHDPGITDTNIITGETWVHDNNYDFEVNVKRKETLKKWLIEVLYTQKGSVRPKMILFWHNYFPFQLQRITLATKAFDYFSIIINYALENFREMLLHQVTGFALLEYHKKIKPSSTPVYKFHADKILNHYLFGQDYTKIISKDRVRKFTRLLNEWSVINDNLLSSATKIRAGNLEKNHYRYANFDLDGHFNEKPVIRSFLRELNDFNGKLLEYEQVAHALSTKIFRWFVYFEIDRIAEKEIINRMTLTALESNYDIKKILSSLLLNDIFYDSKYCGCLIKSPVEYLFGICKELNCIHTENTASIKNYPAWEWMLNLLSGLGQSVGDMPDDRGWAAYYEIPQKIWITPETVIERKRLISEVIIPKVLQEGQISHNTVKQMLQGINNSSDLDVFIEFLVNFFTSTSFFHKKVISVKAFFLANYPVTENTWKNMVEIIQVQPENRQVNVKLATLITSMILYFQDTPEYNFC